MLLKVYTLINYFSSLTFKDRVEYQQLLLIVEFFDSFLQDPPFVHQCSKWFEIRHLCTGVQYCHDRPIKIQPSDWRVVLTAILNPLLGIAYLVFLSTQIYRYNSKTDYFSCTIKNLYCMILSCKIHPILNIKFSTQKFDIHISGL